jgi:hypothetical protein
MALMAEAARRPSLEVRETGTGLRVTEAGDRFAVERWTERAVRCVAGGAVLGAYVQWFLPASLFPGDPVMAKGMLSALFAAVGVALWLFADRGFRNELLVDRARGELVHLRRNAAGRGRIKARLPLAGVESAFVHRTGDGSGMATLRLRLMGGGPPVVLLRGDLSELEAAHRTICRELRLEAASPVPRRALRLERAPRLGKPARAA